MKLSCAQAMFIAGEVGDLEAVISDAGGKHVAVLSHPHPAYGGSMHDGVLSTLSEAFHSCGVRTMRYNFRGVGLSQGHYSGTQEWQDVVSIASYCSRHEMFIEAADSSSSGPAIYLCGYSFGAGMTFQALVRLRSLYPQLADQIRGCLLIAPPLQMLPAPVETLPCRTRVIVGARDHVVAAEDLENYFGSDNVTVIEHTDHFFVGAQESIFKSVEELVNGS